MLINFYSLKSFIRSYVLFSILVLALGFCASSLSAKEKNTPYQQAITAENKQQFNLAIKLYLKALDLKSTSSQTTEILFGH